MNRPNQAEPKNKITGIKQHRQVIQMKMRSPAEGWNTEELLKETAEKKVSKTKQK